MLVAAEPNEAWHSFYWHGMDEDVRTFVRCVKTVQTNPKARAGQLFIAFSAARPFTVVTLGLVGVNRSRLLYRFTLVSTIPDATVDCAAI